MEMLRQNVRPTAWRILAELFRRHHAVQALRIFEIHFQGGFYDMISLRRGGLAGPVFCNFNFNFNGSLQLGDGAPGESQGRVEEVLGSTKWEFSMLTDPGEAIDGVASLLGLKAETKKLPPTTPAVLCVRTLASLFEARMLALTPVEARAGWYAPDSEYGPPLNIREWAHKFSEVREAIASRNDALCAKVGSRFWKFGPEGGPQSGPGGVVFDLVTARAFVSGRSEPFADLMGVYAKRRDLRDVVYAVEQHLPA